MLLHKIQISNFRLLSKVELLLEEKSTVIVGRNNSGKTSLAELFQRLLRETNPSFRMEDFSLSAHEEFWKAYLAHQEDKPENEIRALLPTIEVTLTVSYGKDEMELGMLGECIIDMDSECTEAIIWIRYQLKNGEIKPFFSDLFTYDAQISEASQKTDFCRAIRDRIPKHFASVVSAVDKTDATNVKIIDWATLRGVVASGFINAQRGLDDVTSKDRDVLGKVLEALLKNAQSESAADEDKAVAKQLETAVQDIQTGIDAGFNQQLQALLPAFSLFGYPGLADPALRTETTLDVERLLTNHTKVHYAGINGINLPEAYNGLGARNLIFILLKLLEFYKAFLAQKTAPGIHLVFIEEPEVHLHPQMQEVFIAQLGQIAKQFEQTIGKGRAWPVQFLVTTHSSHLANKAEFAAMRYFMVKTADNGPLVRSTVIKDLRAGLGGTSAENLEFLHKYMTLTRCDLLFADKAVLIEGTVERLLLPSMIEKIEEGGPKAPKLSTQYVSVVEVGGFYAHLFFPLLKFLELPTLVITDFDSAKKSDKGRYVACLVSEGERTSNPCIKSWFTPDISPAELLKKTDENKVNALIRLSYELPESDGVPCGRSFEEAFILANFAKFGLKTPSESDASAEAKTVDKSDFALKHAIEQTDWIVPKYISEGLVWLAGINPPAKSEPFCALSETTPKQEGKKTNG